MAIQVHTPLTHEEMGMVALGFDGRRWGDDSLPEQPRTDITSDGHIVFTPRSSRFRGTPVLGVLVRWRDRRDERRAVENCECASCCLDRLG